MKKILILLIFLCTGCWNYNELNDLAIVTALSVDLEKDNIIVNAIVANGKKESNSKDNSSSTVVYEGSGKTFMDAIINLESYMPKKLYLGHITSIVISEDIAKHKMENISDSLLRNSELLRRYYVIISKDNKASDVLKILSPLEMFPSKNISGNLETTSEVSGISSKILFSDFLIKYYENGIEPTLPSIEVIGKVKEGESEDNIKNSKPKTNLKLSNMAIFKGYKFLGFLNDNESVALNILLNKIDNLNYTYYFDNGYVTNKIRSIKSKIKFKDNKYYIDIKGNAVITEINSDFIVNDLDSLDKLNNKLNNEIKVLINNVIDASLYKYESDFIGFGEILYKKDIKSFNKLESDWINYLKEIDIDVKVDIELINGGSIS